MHFIENGYKRFSKTNSTSPGQPVPLILLSLIYHSFCEKGSRSGKHCQEIVSLLSPADFPLKAVDTIGKYLK